MTLLHRLVRHPAAAMAMLAVASGCASATPRSPEGAEAAPAASPTNTSPTEPAATLATFTAEQSTAGQGAFSAVCSECHSISEFRGSDFQYRFRRRTAWHLYTIVSETMPEDNPGALPADTYVSIVAYILQLNGYEAGGSALTPTEAALRQLPLDEVPSSPSGRSYPR